jgi:hypothetical protein
LAAATGAVTVRDVLRGMIHGIGSPFTTIGHAWDISRCRQALCIGSY